MTDCSENPPAWDTHAEERVGELFIRASPRDEDAYRALAEIDRYIVGVCAFIEEVNNGGFDQFFSNMTGDHAEEILVALERIGSTETLVILRDALALFPHSRPNRIRSERCKQLDEIRAIQETKLDGLDDRFYARKEDLHALLLAKWLEANK